MSVGSFFARKNFIISLFRSHGLKSRELARAARGKLSVFTLDENLPLLPTTHKQFRNIKILDNKGC